MLEVFLNVGAAFHIPTFANAYNFDGIEETAARQGSSSELTLLIAFKGARVLDKKSRLPLYAVVA